MRRVSPRARRYIDRSGDPLDGLVNLFDVGIVLAVGFLLAALASLQLTDAFTDEGLRHPGADTVTVDDDDVVSVVPQDGRRVIGRGEKVGSVYQLEDGRLVYVVPSDAPQP